MSVPQLPGADFQAIWTLLEQEVEDQLPQQAEQAQQAHRIQPTISTRLNSLLAFW